MHTSGRNFSRFRRKLRVLTVFSTQEMITMPGANLTRSVMYLYDCFLDDFRDEKYVSALSDLDMTAQVEVSLNYITLHCWVNYWVIFQLVTSILVDSYYYKNNESYRIRKLQLTLIYTVLLFNFKLTENILIRCIF